MLTVSLQMVKPTLLANEFPVNDNKPSNGEVPVLKLRGMWSTSLLPLLRSPLWPEWVVHIRVPFMGQTEIFNHFLYLKPFNCMQTNEHGLAPKLLPPKYSCINDIYLIYMYQQDLALNNKQGLIWYKTKRSIKHVFVSDHLQLFRTVIYMLNFE